MSWSNNPILDTDGQLKEVLAIGVDITERRELEKELLVHPSGIHETATMGDGVTLGEGVA